MIPRAAEYGIPKLTNWGEKNSSILCVWPSFHSTSKCCLTHSRLPSSLMHVLRVVEGVSESSTTHFPEQTSTSHGCALGRFPSTRPSRVRRYLSTSPPV